MRTVQLILLALVALLIIEHLLFSNIPVIVLVTVLATISGISIYLNYRQAALIEGIADKIEKIDVSGIKKEIIKTREMENEYFAKKFKVELDADRVQGKLDGFSDEVEDYKDEFKRITREYEMTYRDMARGLLDLENNMNKELNLLKRAILKLKDEK